MEQVGKVAMRRDGFRQLMQRQVLPLLYIEALNSVNTQGLFSLFSVDDCKQSDNHNDHSSEFLRNSYCNNFHILCLNQFKSLSHLRIRLHYGTRGWKGSGQEDRRLRTKDRA